MKKYSTKITATLLFSICYLTFPMTVKALDFCTDPGFLTVYMVGITLLDIVKIVVPLLIIIFGVIDFGKATIASNDDEIKKAAKSLMFRAISGVIIFLLPTIINVSMNFISIYSDTVSDFAACEGNANKETIAELKKALNNKKNNSGTNSNSNSNSNSNTSTALMEIRTVAPTSNNANWTASKNIFAASGYISQCTWYAHGRAREILDYAYKNGTLTLEKYNAKIAQLNNLTGNGGQWYHQNINMGSYKFAYGTTPKAGALLITSNSSASNPYGHVEVVEKVEGNTLHISEGWRKKEASTNGWNSVFFQYMQKSQSAAERRGHATRGFVGYIYLLD